MAEIGRKTQVWLPWDLNPETTEDRQIFGNIKNNFHFVGRLKKGMSQSQAQQLLTPFVSKHWQQGFVAKYDFFQGWSVEIQVRSLQEVILGDNKSITIMLIAGVMGLVLIASANISNLFLSRSAENQRKMAIQAVIGAKRKHLFKSMLAETSLLMFMSIILALAIAKTCFYIMQRYLGEVLPKIDELSLNFITLGSALLVTVIFALFFAKLSAHMINYNTLNTMLQSSGKGGGLQVSKKTRFILITSQVALATILVFANLSLLKDAIKIINTPIGFTTNNISTLTLNFSATDLLNEEEKKPIMAEIMKNLAALPQVEAIAQGSSPLDGFGIKALTKYPNNIKYIPHFKRIDERYFTLIEQPLLQGENFTIADRRNNDNKLIINQAFAKQLKTDGDVIGMQLSSIGEPDFKIIGIVKDITIPGQTAFGSDDITATVPRAYAPNYLQEQRFMLKIKENQSINRQQLAKVIAAVDARYSVFSFTAIGDLLTQKLFTAITTAITTAILASLVFLLASIGLYGVLNYGIQLRRFELGTRMAIGAKRADVIKLIIKDNAKAILLGIGISVLAIVALSLSFSEQLSQYLTWQLIPLFLVTLGLVSLISFAACYLPLRQYINKPAVYSLRGSE
ncbi:MAG: ABC transporter permease [Alteromonadaceae bacterium]|nr:ABC transporter permease [Alteromonadaceae bacterium]